MAAVYKKTYTKPLPPDAEVFSRKGEQFARWKDAKGRTRVASVTIPQSGKHAGTMRIIVEAGTYTAKYRTGAGHVVEAATGCRSKDGALSVLKQLSDRAEKVRAGVLTQSESAAADHQRTPVAEHFDGYIEHLKSKEADPRYVGMVRAQLDRLAAECCFDRLGDLNATAVERWLVLRHAEGMSAATRNHYRKALVGFGNWCCRTERLMSNVVADLPRADAEADRRRQRRALTEHELGKLLKVARLRPVAEFGRAKVTLPPDECKGRRTWRRAPLTLDTLDAAAERGRKALAKRPDKIAAFERLGRERGLIYKTLLLTGLRQGELASLTAGQLEMDGPTAYAVLLAADEKNREGSDIPLRADLVNDLRSWLADELSRLQSEARLRLGQPVPLRLPADRPIFNVPRALVRILDRDLVAAGIPKRDERGRTVDVHAMRHTFGTHLSKGGVPLRTAQAAMRHSKPDLTANVYTDPKLLDVMGALDALPSLPLDADNREAERMAATGTEDVTSDALAPMLAPNLGKGSISGTSADKSADPATVETHTDAECASDCGRKRKPLLTSPANSGQAKRVKGLEPSTFSLEG